MRPHPSLFRALLLPTLLLLLGPGVVPAAAQEGLRYTQVTRTEMGGPMGAMMGRMGGMEEPTTLTVRIQPPHMRQDTDGSSTILDWEAREVVLLDHDARTFVRLGWDEWTRRMAEAAGQARREQPTPGEWEASVSSERTGRTDRIAGYDAEQALMIMELTGEMPPEERRESPMGEMQMGVVTELWLSTGFPAWELVGREVAAEMWSPDAVAGAMAAMGPRFQVAMEEQESFLEDLRGTPLRTVMSFVMVPQGSELDVDAVLETEELGGSMADMAGQGMRSRMRGLFGGGDEDAPTEQMIMTRMITEVQEVERTTLDPSVFQVPDGYTEGAAPGAGR